MPYNYMITVRVSAYPVPMVPVTSLDDYERLFNLLWELTDGNLRLTDGGCCMEEVL